MLPIEKLIGDMRAQIVELRKAPTYIKATRKWIRKELREAADIEWTADQFEKAWLETKAQLGLNQSLLSLHNAEHVPDLVGVLPDGRRFEVEIDLQPVKRTKP